LWLFSPDSDTRWLILISPIILNGASGSEMCAAEISQKAAARAERRAGGRAGECCGGAFDALLKDRIARQGDS
jgi:hypothetical protein